MSTPTPTYTRPDNADIDVRLDRLLAGLWWWVIQRDWRRDLFTHPHRIFRIEWLLSAYPD